MSERIDDIIENYHGTKVKDPYRWLEDPALEETQAWGEEQNEKSKNYFQSIPEREKIKVRLSELWNHTKHHVPEKVGNRYFFFKNDGLQNQPILYMQESLEHEPVTIIDPNQLSHDGTVALTNYSFSKDGSLLAYGTSKSGSDWQEVKIRHIESGTEYEEVIEWTKFSNIAWAHDKSGFYYSRFPKPGTVPAEDQSNFNRVYWHTLGTSQADDRLIYEQPEEKELAFTPFITKDGAYLVLYVWHGTSSKNRIYYREINSEEPFTRLLDEADASYMPIGNDGSLFYFKTNAEAPRGRIIAIDLQHPKRENWNEIVPEQSDVISFVKVIHDRFVIVYMHQAHHQMKVFNVDGSFVREIPMPNISTVTGVSGQREDKEMFFGLTSYLHPTQVYKYDFVKEKVELIRQSNISFDSASYETKQVFYPSKDGTQVSMFLTFKKGLVLDSKNPTLLYGYGGFNVSLTPAFSTPVLGWLEMGGIYAVANLRGGSEYGEDWHQAGMLDKKQNVFDDFIAAAEWLIENKYTERSKLAISGRSNGGLLVAACMVQRPDLYGAIICGVPVIDMLRYHRFTVGRYWVPEYGNAEKDAEHFKFLYAYSPLHNVREGVEYPPILIATADTDDRVVPAHAKKFAATLQSVNVGENPILLRLEMQAGHGLGKPTSKLIEEETDFYSFLVKELEVQHRGNQP
jgi:prolyl oligopeptidase